MNDSLLLLLELSKIKPVLADIGCSGTRHKIWDPVASNSIMVGFDPDSRKIPPGLKSWYHKVIMVDRAVCTNDEAEMVDFILTDYPSCSSTLEPDLEALENYIFYDYFLPINKVSVAATSLNRVIKEYKLSTIDWIKIDSQGTDLGIIKSLNEQNINNIVAIDVEPGLINAYKGEDLFSEIHEYLINNGFWLAKLHCQEFPRVRYNSLHDIAMLAGCSEDVISKILIGSPTAAESRYLRTIQSVLNCDERQIILLYVFAMVCGLVGYSYDVSNAYAKCYGENKKYNMMLEEIKHQLKVGRKNHKIKTSLYRIYSLKSRVINMVRRINKPMCSR